MPVSLVQFELYQWYFGDNHSLQRGIRKKYLDFWRWVQPAQPSQSAYQITRPDTRLFQLCVGGQGPYLRSAWHLGRSSMSKNKKHKKRKVWPINQLTNQPADQPSDRQIAWCRVLEHANKETKKWHNFLMSCPIWLKYCMEVVDKDLQYLYWEELGGRNFYRTAQPTKNGTLRDFLKIQEILILYGETSSHNCI